MAGLDYSWVIDAKLCKYKQQSADVTRYIDDLILKWKDQWARREEIARDELIGLQG